VVPAVAVLFTVTLTAFESVALPAASRARQTTLCAPLVVCVESQLTWYGVLVSSPPTDAPSTVHPTPATATLSDAVA